MSSIVNLKSQIEAPFTFSQSSLQDYHDCARRFQLRYMEHLLWPAVETEPTIENEKHQEEGERFHRLAQQYFLGLPADKLERLANTPNLTRWWENFISHFPLSVDLNGFTLYPEQTLSASIGNQRLTAKYDLVAVKDNRAIILDWKTYHKIPRAESLKIKWQTRVYQAMLVKAGAQLNNEKLLAPENIEMIYWLPNFPNDAIRFKYDAAQYKRDWSALEKIIREIEGSREFPMTEEKNKCAYCSYRSYCDRGINAGADADVETELDLIEINFENIKEIEL